MATEVVRFNVGGKRYEVSRSLLEMHKDTLLFRSSTEAWQKDPESEIFIERDAERFHYCLDYLRDGKVVIPFNVSKETLMNDMEYCGIDCEWESIIQDMKTIPSLSHVVSLRGKLGKFTSGQLEERDLAPLSSYQLVAHACMLRLEKETRYWTREDPIPEIKLNKHDDPKFYYVASIAFKNLDAAAFDLSLTEYRLRYDKHVHRKIYRDTTLVLEYSIHLAAV